MHIIKTTASIPYKYLHSDKDHQNDALREWSKHAHDKFKIADGRHLGKIEKSPYLGNGLTDRHEILHSDAV